MTYNAVMTPRYPDGSQASMQIVAAGDSVSQALGKLVAKVGDTVDPNYGYLLGNVMVASAEILQKFDDGEPLKATHADFSDPDAEFTLEVVQLGDKDSFMEAKMYLLLSEIESAFDWDAPDQEINGGDVVEFMGKWMKKVKKVLG